MDRNLRLDHGQIEVVDDSMAEVLRKKTPAQRISIADNLWRSVYNMLLSHMGKTHPEWDYPKLKKEVARRFLHGSA